MERAVITSQSGRLDLDRALPELTRYRRDAPQNDTLSQKTGRICTIQELRQLERTNIRRALEVSGWKVSGQQGWPGCWA